jgi:hypothetical protein
MPMTRAEESQKWLVRTLNITQKLDEIQKHLKLNGRPARR